MRFVLDSSVIAKLFVNEEGSDDFYRVWDICHEKNFHLYASELIIYEVGNTIYKNLRNTNKKGNKYIAQIYKLDMDLYPFDIEMAKKSMDTAQKLSITYYDAVHVTLSKIQGAELVTEDKELLKKYRDAININDTLVLIQK
jgi:predicted nucleic acid-binding protein